MYPNPPPWGSRGSRDLADARAHTWRAHTCHTQ